MVSMVIDANLSRCVGIYVCVCVYVRVYVCVPLFKSIDDMQLLKRIKHFLCNLKLNLTIVTVENIIRK